MQQAVGKARRYLRPSRKREYANVRGVYCTSKGNSHDQARSPNGLGMQDKHGIDLVVHGDDITEENSAIMYSVPITRGAYGNDFDIIFLLDIVRGRGTSHNTHTHTFSGWVDTIHVYLAQAQRVLRGWGRRGYSTASHTALSSWEVVAGEGPLYTLTLYTSILFHSRHTT